MNKDDNKMYVKSQYTCAICGKIYDEVQKRMNCEMKCLKKKQEEEKKAAEAKKKAEKDARKKEVDEAFETFSKLINAYCEDYGPYEFTFKADDYNWWPNKIWHNFWF